MIFESELVGDVCQEICSGWWIVVATASMCLVIYIFVYILCFNENSVQHFTNAVLTASLASLPLLSLE